MIASTQRPFDLVASDLDGTLLAPDELVTPRTQIAIKRVLHSGAMFVFATGRPPRWIRPVAEQIRHFGPAVGSNGAIIMDVSGDAAQERVLHTNMLSVTAANEAIQAIKRVLPGAAFAVDGPNGFGHEPNYIPSWPQGDVRIGLITELLDAPVLKVLFKHHEMDELRYQQVIEAVGERCSITFGSMVPVPGVNTLIEVMAPGVSKATALQWICDQHGIDRSRVLAFGDMPNDIEMLRWAGHGVAMDNAHDWIKEAANDVTASNADDGVAKVLEALF